MRARSPRPPRPRSWSTRAASSATSSPERMKGSEIGVSPETGAAARMSSADDGHEHRAGGDLAAVALGEGAEVAAIARDGEADCDAVGVPIRMLLCVGVVHKNSRVLRRYAVYELHSSRHTSSFKGRVYVLQS